MTCRIMCSEARQRCHKLEQVKQIEHDTAADKYAEMPLETVKVL